MMCPCLTDLSISREVVTTAAQLQAQGSLWAEVQSVCFVSPLGLSQRPECSCEKPSRAAQSQQEWIMNFTAATEQGKEGQLHQGFLFLSLTLPRQKSRVAAAAAVQSTR